MYISQSTASELLDTVLPVSYKAASFLQARHRKAFNESLWGTHYILLKMCQQTKRPKYLHSIIELNFQQYRLQFYKVIAFVVPVLVAC